MPHISIGSENLHYLRMGIGSHVLLAFHGYGEQAGSFAVFEPVLGHQYTILSFDLPYHGATDWSKPHFTEADLQQLVTNVMAEYKVERVSLMGYSIGGRVCLSVVKSVPQYIDKVLLMASDGLIVNKFYWFFNRVPLGKFLFTNFLNSGRTALRVAELCRKLRIIREGQYRLAEQVLQTPEKRMQLLHAWPCLSMLVIPPAELKVILNKHKIPVYLVMGAADRILPPSLGKQFANGANTVRLTILDRGHRIFDAGNAKQIAAPLLEL